MVLTTKRKTTKNATQKTIQNAVQGHVLSVEFYAILTPCLLLVL